MKIVENATEDITTGLHRRGINEPGVDREYLIYSDEPKCGICFIKYNILFGKNISF